VRFLRNFWARNRANLFLMLLIFLFVLFFFANRIFIFIDAGQNGVLFRRFFGGVVTTRVYNEGLELIPPWDSMTLYDVRVQETRWSYSVLSSNSLSLDVEVSARFHPYQNSLPLLHQRIGPDYVTKVVIPIVEASVRRAVGERRAEDIYTLGGAVTDQINQAVSAALGEYFVASDGVVIRSITLPERIRLAVEAKEEQRELMEAYEYRIRREKEEALRKEIEAFGLHNFNSIIGPSLSPRLLQWRALEATEELAKSDNAKVVIMGNGEKGLPVLLNADVGGAAPTRIPSSAELLQQTRPLGRLDEHLATTNRLFEQLFRRNLPETAPPAASPAPSPSPTPLAAVSPNPALFSNPSPEASP